MSAGRFLLPWTLTAILASGFGFDVASPVAGPSDRLVVLPSTGVDRSSARPLPFSYDLYTFRGEGGRTTVVATFAVEAGELETERVGGDNRYRFGVTLVLADTALKTVTNRHDSVFVELPRSVRDQHLLYTHIEVQAPPSHDILQRLTMIDATKAGIGQLYWKYTQIPDYSGTELMLSDVALGQPDAPTGWKRGEATLGLLPTSRFPSSAFDVYYEIYNLPVGNPYTTEVTVQRLADIFSEEAEDHEPVRLLFSGESAAAADGTLPELRRVGTSLAEGRYRITVTIEDQSTGKTTSRSRTFEIHTSWRGATMVPAFQVQPKIG
jgi:hypothetical protein